MDRLSPILTGMGRENNENTYSTLVEAALWEDLAEERARRRLKPGWQVELPVPALTPAGKTTKLVVGTYLGDDRRLVIALRVGEDGPTAVMGPAVATECVSLIERVRDGHVGVLS